MIGSLLLRGALDGIQGLPEELARHLDPLPAPWLPEIAHVALILAIRDARFTGPTGEDAFAAWLHRLNADLLPDRSDIGPSKAVHFFPALWAGLHEGTTLEVLDAGPTHALLASLHPEPIFPALANRWRRDAIAGYLVRAGAVQPRVSERGRIEGRTHIAITWT
jgi:hypothetical protein